MGLGPRGVGFDDPCAPFESSSCSRLRRRGTAGVVAASIGAKADRALAGTAAVNADGGSVTAAAGRWVDLGGGPRNAASVSTPASSSPRTKASRVSLLGSCTGRVTLTMRMVNGAGGCLFAPAFSSLVSPPPPIAFVPPVCPTYLNRLRCTTSTLGSLTIFRVSTACVPSHPPFSHLRSNASGAKNPVNNAARSVDVPPSSGSSTERWRNVSWRVHSSPHASHVNVAATAVVKFLRVGHKVLCSGTILSMFLDVSGPGILFSTSRPRSYAAVTSSSRASRHSHRNSCASCCWLPT